MIRVAGIEASIMGELPLTGRPCVIVRLAGCRLRCAWCDTPAALDAHGPGTRGMSVGEVLERTRTLGPATVLLTGGEPMDQAETPELAERFLEAGLAVVLETGGANDLSGMSALRKRRGGVLIQVADVKCPASGECGTFLESNLDRLDGRDRLKFVVEDRADYRWALRFLDAHGLGSRRREAEAGPRGSGARSSAGGASGGGRPGILLSPLSGALAPADLAGWMLEDRLEGDLNLQVHKLIGMP